jgi:hypothetical protein
MKGKLTLFALAIVALVLYSCNQNAQQTQEQAKEGLAAAAPPPAGVQTTNSYDSQGKFSYIVTFDSESESYYMMKYNETTVAIDSPTPYIKAQKITMPDKNVENIKYFTDAGVPKVSATTIPAEANFVVNKHTFSSITAITTANGFVRGTDVKGSSVNEPVSNLVYIGKDAGSGGIVLGFCTANESN